MNHAEFIGLIIGAPVTYSVTLVITLAVYLILFRKQINSFFDPLFFAVVFAAFAASDVVFLWWLDVIEPRYFIQFFATEAAFFIGLTMFRPAKPPRSPIKNAGKRSYFVVWHGGEKQLLIVLYVLSGITFVVTQAITYAIRGIPILYRSRLEYYSVGGGIGALDRILNITWFTSCYLLMYCLAAKVRVPRVFHAFIGVALVTSALLSGSKSTFTAMLFAAFYFRFLRRGESDQSSFHRSLAKAQKMMFVSTIAASMLVIGVQAATGDPAVLIESLAVRFASFGDVNFMAYPSHVVDSVPKSSPFLAVFGDMLAPFRLVSYDKTPEPLGFLLHRIVYGFDDFTGPNARHNVFGLVYFGFVGSILFSLILGMIVGFIRNLLSAFVRPGSAIEPLYVFLAISCVGVTTDFTLVIKDIVSIILVAPPLYAVAALICLASRRERVRFSSNTVATPATGPNTGSACPC
jgi:oligosaccharide repeat unit polymerase